MRDIEQATFDQISIDISTFMATLFHSYPKHEHMISNVLCDSLGALVAIAAKEPSAALTHLAERLKNYDWKEVRSAHYLAVNHIRANTDIQRPSPAKVLQFGVNHAKPE